MTLQLTLKALPTEKVKGTYTIHGVANRMPDHALFLEPAAADSFLADLAEHIAVSDMFRTPESSLLAVETGRGALRPGFSGHNFGKSIDIEVAAAMKTLNFTSKAGLDHWMAERGWFCFWTDGKPTHVIHGKETASETWHSNFFGKGYVISPKVETTTGYLEAELKKLYEPAFQAMLASVKLQQTALAQVKMYGGAIDDIPGPQTKRGVICFQKAWDLEATGEVDYRTARTLAYVTRTTTVV